MHPFPAGESRAGIQVSESHCLTRVVHIHSCSGSSNLLSCQIRARGSSSTAQEDPCQRNSLKHQTKMIPGNQGHLLEEMTLRQAHCGGTGGRKRVAYLRREVAGP